MADIIRGAVVLVTVISIAGILAPPPAATPDAESPTKITEEWCEAGRQIGGAADAG